MHVGVCRCSIFAFLLWGLIICFDESHACWHFRLILCTLAHRLKFTRNNFWYICKSFLWRIFFINMPMTNNESHVLPWSRGGNVRERSPAVGGTQTPPGPGRAHSQARVLRSGSPWSGPPGAPPTESRNIICDWWIRTQGLFVMNQPPRPLRPRLTKYISFNGFHLDTFSLVMRSKNLDQLGHCRSFYVLFLRTRHHSKQRNIINIFQMKRTII